MKYLIVTAKYKKDNVEHIEEAKVPFEVNHSITLPDKYPFNLNVYLGGDAGFNLRNIFVTSTGKLDYMNDYINPNEDEEHLIRRDDGIVFKFRLVDE